MGWNSKSNDKLRIYVNKDLQHIRFNKVDSNNKVYYGPQTSIENIL